MPRPEPRLLTVCAVDQVTPNMRRVTLGGDGLSGFPADQEGGYVKLRLGEAEGRPIVRTYTIRHQRENEIDIDFALHGVCGPATQWALETKPGDTIKVGGPGPKKLVDAAADYIVFTGDMTALPAISVNLALLESDRVGHAVLEVIDEADIQQLAHPSGVQIEWVVNPEPGKHPQLLADRVKRIAWPAGSISAWVACEFSAMRMMRDDLRGARGLSAEELYISSYWKLGSDEDNHRLAKRADLEQGA